MASLSSSLSIFSNTPSHSLSFHSSSQNPLKSSIPSTRSHTPSLICCSSKKKTSFTDQILDYIEGGPKLRKWYGALDILPKDGGLVDEDDESPEAEEIQDAVLVTDGDSEIGQMVILSLILKRSRVKALVKDKRAMVEAFGTYVESMAGDVSDRSFLKKALKGVRAVICPPNVWRILIRCREHERHTTYHSSFSGSSGIQALMNRNARKLAERDEAAVIASGIPYTIIRAGSLQNSPGGEQGFSFKEGSATQGRLSKEDAALICVEALDAVPQKGLVFEVVNGGEKVSDWKECFASLITMEQQLQ
ncbi:uncharacterized protein LOC131227357 isoform X3 [Magnolia sinica]|uniref:uncharacterized protein LOC131227357 isoform X3 n=1 Tax=Magnolia sinica TaxID=86752 RepID=UPI00265B6727|nr:uncharacterized protein LOC131227357 isoform X3 [Magnolia sinica]